MPDASPVAPLAGFVLGYLAILVVPGPNFLVIGGIAALRGMSAAWPLCAGIAFGASLLSVGAYSAARWGAHFAAFDDAGRVVAALLLLYAAMRLVLCRTIATPAPRRPALSRGETLANFATGVATAATNPVTAAFFASQFLGALPEDGVRVVALGVVPPLALLFGVALAYGLSRPGAQRVALAWRRPLCAASALVLGSAAVMLGMPLLVA